MKHYAAQPDLFTRFIDSPPNGEVLRDIGIKQVQNHNQDWKDMCLALFADWTLPPTFTGEDLRRHWEAAGLIPTHPNAWGSLIMTMVKRHLIVPTGQYVPMRDPRSHARKTALYSKP